MQCQECHRHLMFDSFQVENVVHGKSQYNSTVEALTSIIREQGWRQLYAGLSINYIRVCRIQELMWVVHYIRLDHQSN